MTDTSELTDAQILRSAVYALSPAQMPEPDISQVMPQVTRGVEAYNKIKERVALIRQELNAAQAQVKS